MTKPRIFASLAGLLLLPLLWAGPALAAPDIQHWSTGNGARVYFVHSSGLPMVDIRVVFDAGSARDGERAGLAELTNGLLAEGAGGVDADTISARFDDVGADFSNSSLRDMAIVSLRSLTEPKLLTPAVKTFAMVLAHPDFPARAFERERKAMLLGLKQDEQSPGAIASKRFYAMLYGSHPYASPSDGTKASLTAMTRDAVEAFYRKYYVGANAVVAIVGDLSRKQAEQLASDVVGGLPKGEPAASLPKVTPVAKAEHEEILHPSTQTHVLVGQEGIRRGDPDYFALYVGNHILGGSGLVSLISEQIREKRGLAYSPYSYFVPMHAAGPFVMGLQTRNKERHEALKVLRQTLKDFIAKGPTKQELQLAKRNITGSFPLKIDSNRDIVEYLAMIGFYHLPLDYLHTFNAHIQSVTLAQVRDAFRRHIHPDRMVTVTVGGAN